MIHSVLKFWVNLLDIPVSAVGPDHIQVHNLVSIPVFYILSNGSMNIGVGHHYVGNEVFGELSSNKRLSSGL